MENTKNNVPETSDQDRSVQVVIDEDFISIHRGRYEELLHAEKEREILFHAYQLMNAFSMESVMDAIFNPKFKHSDKETAGGRDNA